MLGGGAYWFLQSNINQADFQSSEDRAKGVSLSISSQIDTLQSTLDKIASSSETVKAIESKDVLKMTQTAMMLQQFMPKIINLRVLPIDIDKLNQSSLFDLGNADVVMIQESIALKKEQQPTVQGVGKNRHLAITSIVHKNDAVIGIVFASLHPNFLQDTLNKFQATNSVIELKQNNTPLAVIGDLSNKNETDHSFVVAGTAWTIHYWHLETINSVTLLYFAGITVLAILLIFLACFVSKRKLQRVLVQDCNNIASIIKDLVSEKNVGSYPMYFHEMEAVTTKVVQLKHDLIREDASKKSAEKTMLYATKKEGESKGDMSDFGF